MITHESIKIFDKNIVSQSSCVNNKCTCFSSQHFFFFFWYIDWMLFFTLITKNTNANRIPFFSIFWVSLTLTGNFMSLEWSFLEKILSTFVTAFGLWSAESDYLAKQHLKHLLSSIFWILIKPFLGWFNSFGNLM